MELKIDLTKLIEQTVDQVYGSDERSLFYEFLARNGQQEQIVAVEFNNILPETADDPGEQADIWTCPHCRQEIHYDYLADVWRCGCPREEMSRLTPHLSRQ